MALQNKNVLVTGGAGFIGSALVRLLLKGKANVTVLDNFLSGRRSNLKELEGSIEIVEGSILGENLAETLSSRNIGFVLNLAAEPYIPKCYETPRSFFEINALGALNVMLACKEAGITRIVQYSSSEVYGSALKTPMDETHPTLPRSTYAVSKLAADRLCYTLNHEQGLPVVILRQFNVFGPRETHPYIIPELISQLSSTEKITLGNIKASRDFTYVEDAARAAMLLLECKNAEGEAVNCGFGKDYTVEEMAEITAEVVGQKKPNITIDQKRIRPLDVQCLRADYSKLNKLTGWEPKVSFREGLERTVAWFRENNNKWVWEE
ncbi:MAG: GDP-mannose 4,6-dehydratase [Candidatus Diapherotrites archaeon]